MGLVGRKVELRATSGVLQKFFLRFPLFPSICDFPKAPEWMLRKVFNAAKPLITYNANIPDRALWHTVTFASVRVDANDPEKRNQLRTL